MDRKKKERRQGIFWILTIPHYGFTPYLPRGCSWITGQLELGESGFLHWQIVVSFTKKMARKGVREMFGPYFCELTISAKANQYVRKSETAIQGTQFELGAKPIVRSNGTEWEEVWELAKAGEIERIPANIRIQSYRTLRTICSDYASPAPLVRRIFTYWGKTGTGKSRRAWDEAGLDAFPKDPNTKFWDGYRNQEHVVIDEFRGSISISHVLRWFDRHPVIVEIKGSSTVFKAKTIWITSNLDPRLWYPDLDEDTRDALMRRMEITHFDSLS